MCSIELLPSNKRSSTMGLINEKDISRQALLDIAPDRESVIMGLKTVEEIRQTLKIHPDTMEGHWLYSGKKKSNFNIRDANTRLSTLIRKPSRLAVVIDDSFDATGVNGSTVRRAISSSPTRPRGVMDGIENRLMSANGWNDLRLSTQDKLISPRPLGPTHILVIYPKPDDDPLPSDIPPGKSSLTQADSLRRPSVPRVRSEAMELPINDLLFVLNVPNIAQPNSFPRRMPHELPRIFMEVPHLDTFPELVVYLHTKNQAELFRKLIPEWLKDVMHPLPSLGSVRETPSPQEVCADLTSKWPTIYRILRRKRYSPYLHRQTHYQAPPDAFHFAVSMESQANSTSTLNRSLETIAQEIAHVDWTCYYSRTDPSIDGAEVESGDGISENLVVATIAKLDALRDNLEHIGYFGRQLWFELGVSREILVRALNWKAKVDRVGI